MSTGDTRVGKALGTDYFLIRPELTDSERDYLDRTRVFVEDEVLPEINGYWERADLPLDLLRRLGELGLVGDGIEGYGCPEMSAVAAGLVHMEMNRGDGSLGTGLGVQAGLAMRSIAMLGSEEQKLRWLPPMARMERLGAFALTEPEHGSDSVALETSARRDGSDYLISGAKRWIGLGTVADVVVVWARDTEDGQVKGFLVEPPAPGFDARVIEGKAALRAVWQADIVLTDVRVPEDARLPGANSFKDTAAVLRSTRQTCAWSALGHAVAAYDAALTYTTERTQFGKPIASFQMVQERLVKMLAEVTAMQLYCLRIGRLLESDQMSDTIAALAKLNNTVKARHVIAEARNLLGGNGLLLDYHVIRHMSDIEAIYTYEGTEAIQTLLVGRDITGVGALPSHGIPPDADERPVVVLGAGTLGSRIALMFAAGGSPVRIYNRTPEKAHAAVRFVEEDIAGVRDTLGLCASEPGEVKVAASLEAAVAGAWLIIESLAEDLELKRRVFGELDRLADPDAILATNSSSYPSSEMLDEVSHRERVLNMHFLMPPQVNPVELMSCGGTDEAIVDALMERLPRYGLSPYRVGCQSVGFIFNRIWAAIKREALMTVAEGAATPEDIDRMWQEIFRSTVVPFRMMDQVGLDVVLDIEEHYAEIRDAVPESPRTLVREYIDRGRLGVKSGQGFYDDYANATNFEEPTAVIQHIVLLKLDPGATDEQVQAAFEAGSELPNEIPGVSKISYGRDRSDPAHGFTLVSVVELSDEDALETYMSHPKRLEWIDRHVAPLTEERIELDVPSDGAHLPATATWYWGIALALEE